MYDEFFTTAQRLAQDGVPFVTAVVVRAEAPTSAKPGDKAIITADGVMHGWIGGSCAQPTVIQEALKALAADEGRFIRLSERPDEQPPRPGLRDLPLTCYSGGTLEIYLEPQHPRPRLLVVGALPVARALVALGRAMHYDVVAVDPGGDGTAVTAADTVLTNLDDIAGQVRPGTYVVVATHGEYDELALAAVLAARPSYVGLVASPRRGEEVRRYLRAEGLSEEALLPLKAPAGLDIQARRGDEIALSIMAEIVQRRRSAELLDLALLQAEAGAEEATAATAVDPVCGMTVEIDGAVHTIDHDGRTFYFCCAGCRQSFAAAPAEYVTT